MSMSMSMSSMAMALAREFYERSQSRPRRQVRRLPRYGETRARAFAHRTTETARPIRAQFRTMKKYRYFNNLGSRRKFTRQAKNASPGLKISFKGRKF
jgi:hypothetical protein